MKDRLKVFSGGVRLHQCINCGKVDAWERGWIWRGSIKDLEEGNIEKFCSVKCAREHMEKTRNGN